jgi:hypothetical protein
LRVLVVGGGTIVVSDQKSSRCFLAPVIGQRHPRHGMMQNNVVRMTDDWTLSLVND